MGQQRISSAPHMTWAPNGRVQACVPHRHLECGVLRRTRYRPSIGVTSSMLLGLEYAAGLRDGSGRSALVP